MAFDCSSENPSSFSRCTNFRVSKWWSRKRKEVVEKGFWETMRKAVRRGFGALAMPDGCRTRAWAFRMVDIQGLGVLLPYSYQGCAMEVTVRWEEGLWNKGRVGSGWLICAVRGNVRGTVVFHVNCGSRKRGIEDFDMLLRFRVLLRRSFCTEYMEA